MQGVPLTTVPGVVGQEPTWRLQENSPRSPGGTQDFTFDITKYKIKSLGKSLLSPGREREIQLIAA